MQWEGGMKRDVPEYSTGNVKRGLFPVLNRHRSYGNNPEYRPASCKCSCCCFYYSYSYASRPKADSKHGWDTEHVNMIEIHPCGTIYGDSGPSYSQHRRILWSIYTSCFWLAVHLKWSFSRRTLTSQRPLGLSVASLHANILAECQTKIIDVSDKLI